MSRKTVSKGDFEGVYMKTVSNLYFEWVIYRKTVSKGDVGFPKNIHFRKNQNLEICMRTFSMRRVRPYGHI